MVGPPLVGNINVLCNDCEDSTKEIHKACGCSQLELNVRNRFRLKYLIRAPIAAIHPIRTILRLR